MTTIRTTISLPAELARRMKAAPKFNVSAAVAAAIEERLNGKSKTEQEAADMYREVLSLRARNKKLRNCLRGIAAAASELAEET